MPQWEYDKIDLNALPPKTEDIDLLDEAGRDGWELVGITAYNVAYLKRPLGDVGAAAQPAKAPARRRAAS